MDAGFINRLVGTVIVVIAAIVFIPNILDGEKQSYSDEFRAIPERPEFKSIDLKAEIEKDKPDLAHQAKAAPVEDITPDDASLDEQNKVAEEAKDIQLVNTTEAPTSQAQSEQVTASQDAAPQNTDVVEVSTLKRDDDSHLSYMAYVIQLGSFSHKANVEKLMEKLKKAGFTTFTRPVTTPSGTLTKVFVGPELDQAVLEKKLPELKQLTNLNGKITQFEVVK